MLKNGPSYQVRYRLPDGTQVSQTHRTLKNAKAFETAVGSKKLKGLSVDIRRGKMTFAELASKWRESKSKKAPKTLTRYDGILRNHIIPILGLRPLDSIKHSDIQDLVNKWEGLGLSPRSIYQHIQVLKPILQFAVKDERIGMNPAVGITKPDFTTVVRHPLDPDECEALLAAMEPRSRIFVEYALAVGLRYEELEALDIGDLDFKKGLIFVRKSKSEAGVRSMPISDDEVEQLKDYIIASGRHLSQVSEPLFISPNGHRFHYSNFMKRKFKPACEIAGLADITFHDLRRTYGTMLSELGYDPKTIATLMGHENYSTSFRYYIAPSAKAKKASAGAMKRFRSQALINTSSESMQGDVH